MQILCTNGLKSVMTELVPTLQRQSGSGLALTWGSTVALAKEIAAGARGDIAILTREAIDDLVKAGKAVVGSRVDLARSGIGLAVRKGARKPDISSPDALRHALLAANTVAHSKAGQSGIYFPTVLERLGISEQMKPKLVVPEGGVPIGEIVASGGAEIGIQQISELMPVEGIEIVVRCRRRCRRLHFSPPVFFRRQRIQKARRASSRLSAPPRARSWRPRDWRRRDGNPSP